MFDECAGCGKLVNGDFKCHICKKHIHLSCSATQAEDGVVEVVCRHCHFMNEDLSSKSEATVDDKDYAPAPTSSDSSADSEASISSHDSAGRDNTLCK